MALVSLKLEEFAASENAYAGAGSDSWLPAEMNFSTDPLRRSLLRSLTSLS